MKKHEAPHLERLQRRFWEFIVSPYGVRDAMPTLAEQDPESVPLLNWIKAGDEEMAIHRLDVYANMYFFRLVDVLGDQYEALRYVLGHDTFKLMCVDFFKMYPTENFSLDYIGDNLPEFLEEHNPPDRPQYLPELTKLERARYKMIVAPDSEALTPESLQTIPAEHWGNLQFRSIPALQLMTFEYPIHKVWRAMRDESEVPTLAPDPTAIVVWRSDFTVMHEVVSSEVASALTLLLEGKPFEEICMSFLPDTDSDEIEPEALQRCIQAAYQNLSHWVQSGMLQALS